MEWEFDDPSPYDLLMQQQITFDEFYRIKMEEKEE